MPLSLALSPAGRGESSSRPSPWPSPLRGEGSRVHAPLPGPLPCGERGVEFTPLSLALSPAGRGESSPRPSPWPSPLRGEGSRAVLSPAGRGELVPGAEQAVAEVAEAGHDVRLVV